MTYPVYRLANDIADGLSDMVRAGLLKRVHAQFGGGGPEQPYRASAEVFGEIDLIQLASLLIESGWTCPAKP